MTSLSEQAAQRQGEQNKIIGKLQEDLAAEIDPEKQKVLKHRIAGHTAEWWRLAIVKKPKRRNLLKPLSY